MNSATLDHITAARRTGTEAVLEVEWRPVFGLLPDGPAGVLGQSLARIHERTLLGLAALVYQGIGEGHLNGHLEDAAGKRPRVLHSRLAP